MTEQYTHLKTGQTLEVLISQAELMSLESLKHLVAKRKGGDSPSPIQTVRWVIRKSGWFAWATNRYVAGFLEVDTDVREHLGETEQVDLPLDPDTLDLLKKRFVTSAAGQRDKHFIAVQVGALDDNGRYEVTFQGGDIDGDLTMTLDQSRGQYPKLQSLIPSGFDSTEHVSFEFDRLSLFSKVILPHEAHLAKSSRSTGIRLEFSPEKVSGSRAVKVRLAKDNAGVDGEGVRFYGMLMSRRSEREILSA